MLYYLAYGSNLNKSLMQKRCKTAQIKGSYVLNGYKLVFKYYLTIEKDPQSKVYLGVWKIEQSDLKALDDYEDYPRLYRKEYLNIELDGTKEQGLIYIMNDIRQYEKPSKTYFNKCLKGFKDFNFNEEILYKAYYAVEEE